MDALSMFDAVELDPFQHDPMIPIEDVPIEPLRKKEEELQTTCQQCDKQFHHPCSCDQIKEWNEKLEKPDVEVVIKCPSCSHKIEKDTGSNNLCCEKCDREFCFVCEKVWNGHGHCVRVEPNGDPYAHYLKIYNMNQLSEELTEKQLTHGMAALLEAVTRTLAAGHAMLKYCAVFAYYSNADNKQFFRMWRDLEREVQDTHNQVNAFVIDLDEIQRSHDSVLNQYKTMLKYI
jgi:DNA-directed RNA polymerase subunit RPC12/RpoP